MKRTKTMGENEKTLQWFVETIDDLVDRLRRFGVG